MAAEPVFGKGGSPPFRSIHEENYIEASALLDAEDWQACIAAAHENLSYPGLPRYWRIQNLLLISEATNDWHQRENCRVAAEQIWGIARRETPNTQRDAIKSLQDVRGELDQLSAWQERESDDDKQKLLAYNVAETKQPATDHTLGRPSADEEWLPTGHGSHNSIGGQLALSKWADSIYSEEATEDESRWNNESTRQVECNSDGGGQRQMEGSHGDKCATALAGGLNTRATDTPTRNDSVQGKPPAMESLAAELSALRTATESLKAAQQATKEVGARFEKGIATVTELEDIMVASLMSGRSASGQEINTLAKAFERLGRL
ncbi:uncharacterized protein LTR77_007946 [Saxophila tyrrhenica]|uniref:Uncharacterized protein n=1 Tax=Saxophila tyrrhenica TaxID=1690608 RepID=A0AAV9P6E4_9PEZI|nr:hypothetical protein LTR77_007946 [Saxophila tyrrhenica]